MRRTLVALGATVVLGACGGGTSDDEGNDNGGDPGGPGTGGLTAPPICWEVPPRHVRSGEAPFQQTLSALGGSGPMSFTIRDDDLPPEASISLDATTGEVSLVPPARPGRYRLNYEVSDAEGRHDSGELVLWVQPRIMPLGDSITDGKYDAHDPEGKNGSARAGYRIGLWNALKDAGYPIDFVGTYKAGPTESGFDRDHQGKAGATAYDLRAQIYGWLDELETASSGGLIAHGAPDIVLLHAGTNDLNQSGGREYDAEAALRELIIEIDAWYTGQGHPVTIVLAELIGAEEGSDSHNLENEGVQALNGLLPALAADFPDRVRLLDQYSALADAQGTPDPDLYSDRLHPNQDGYDRMAERWLEGLSDFELLGKCGQ